jgi:putative peptidoglycan lipid II flippase
MNRRRLNLFRALAALWWGAMAVASHWPYLGVDRMFGFDNQVVPLGIDKWGHVLAYAGLVGLVTLARFGGGRGGGRLIIALAFGVAYSFIDELTQAWVPGRFFEWSDLLASNIGVACGALGSAIAIYLRRPGDSFVDHARLVSLITLISRVFGLGRDWALAFAFGFTGVLDAFVIAFMIPNLTRRLFGEGALAAAFVPHYATLDRDHPPSARQLAFQVIRWLWISLLIGSGVGFLICIGLLLSGWLGDRGQLAAALTAITIWYAPLVCVTALLGAMLQVHRRFGVPAAAPVLLNVCIIAAALGFAMWPGEIQPQWGVCIVAAAVLVAGGLQLIASTAALARHARPFRPDPGYQADRVDPARKRLMGHWLATVVGLAVFQLNVALDAGIAMFFSAEPGQRLNLFGRSIAYPMETGAVAVLGATARLYEFPLGVFGIAVATAIFPALAAASDQRERFADLLRQGLRLTLLIGLPASAGLVLIRYPLARAIYFGEGRMTGDDAARIAHVLLGYAPAVWAYSLNHVLTRTFYARHNPITPMRLSLVMILLNLALNLTLIWLPVGQGQVLGAAGLAWSTAICAVIQCALLLWLVRRYVPAPVDAAVGRSWARSLILTLVMSLVVFAVMLPFDPQTMSRLGLIGLVGAAVGAGGLTVALGAWLMGMAELDWILRRQQRE